jgi:hypothetical protein
LTAKTKHGHKAHGPTHGADPGTPHERLNRMHAMPNRAEGQPMSAAASPAMAPTPAPPMGAGAPMGAPPMAPPGAGPSPDDEEGEQT